jgi:hypothetical protein
MLELKAKGHDEGEDIFEERLPIAKQLDIRRFASEIDADRTVLAGLVGSVAHGSPLGPMVSSADDPRWGKC